MSENGLVPVLTVAVCESYATDSEGQRNAKSALLDVARTLGEVTVADADGMRQEFCDSYARAVKFLKVQAKSKGSGFTARTELDWLKAGQKPPLLAQLHEAAGHVFKLRALGAFPGDLALVVDVAKFREKHAARWAGKGA